MSSEPTPSVQPDGEPEIRDAGIPGTRSFRMSDKIPPGEPLAHRPKKGGSKAKAAGRKT